MPALIELALQVAGGVGELGEDEDLLAGEFLGLEQADELLQLVVVLGLELPGLVEELHDLVEVEEGLGHHLLDLVLLAVEAFDGVEHLLGHDVLVLGLVAVLAPEPELALRCVAEDFRVLGLPALKTLLLGVGLAVHLKKGEQLLQQAVARELEGGEPNSRSALRKLVRMRPTTCFCRFCSNGSMLLSGPCTRPAGSTSAA